MEHLSFGERLKLLRKAGNIKQEDFALALKVTRGCVANYENNKRMPNQATLCNIAKFFNVSTDFLVIGTKVPELFREKFEAMNYFKEYVDIRDMHPDDKSEMFIYKEKLISKRKKTR